MKRTTITLVPALALGLALSACGGSDSSSSSEESPSESSSTSSDDFASASAEDQAAAAAEAMSGLESVHLVGDVTQADQDVSLDVSATTAGDCTGTIGLGEGTAEVLSVGGESWFRPDEAFWQEQAPSPQQAQQIIQVVGDKWVVQSEGFAEFCDLDTLLEGISDDTSTYEAGEETDVDGTPAIAIDSTDANGETSTGYVATEDPHYLLRIEKTDGDSQGTVDLTDFDEPVDAQAPPENEIIDLDQL